MSEHTNYIDEALRRTKTGFRIKYIGGMFCVFNGQDNRLWTTDKKIALRWYLLLTAP